MQPAWPKNDVRFMKSKNVHLTFFGQTNIQLVHNSSKVNHLAIKRWFQTDWTIAEKESTLSCVELVFSHVVSKNVHFNYFGDGVRLGDQIRWKEHTILHKKKCISNGCRGGGALFHIWWKSEKVNQTIQGKDIFMTS